MSIVKQLESSLSEGVRYFSGGGRVKPPVKPGLIRFETVLTMVKAIVTPPPTVMLQWQANSDPRMTGRSGGSFAPFIDYLPVIFQSNRVLGGVTGARRTEIIMQVANTGSRTEWRRAYVSAASIQPNADLSISLLLDALAEDMASDYVENCRGDLFHLAILLEVLGNDSPWRLKDARSFWYCLLLSMRASDWELVDERVLVAALSIARIQRRLGEHTSAIALLSAIGNAGVDTFTLVDQYAPQHCNDLGRVELAVALANPYIFDQIDPLAWFNYIGNRVRRTP